MAEDAEPESDFSILPSMSPEGQNENSLSSHVNLQMCLSATPDLSTEEVQQHLKELLLENLELKETLQHNSATMRQQFQTLISWQDEMMNVHQQHKQRFEESRELIKKLKEERQELLKKTGDMENTLKEFQEQASMSADLLSKVEQFTAQLAVETKEKDELRAELERQQVMKIHLEGAVQELTCELQQAQLCLQQHGAETKATALKDDMKGPPEDLDSPLVTEEFGYTVIHHPPGLRAGFEQTDLTVFDQKAVQDLQLQLCDEQAKTSQLNQQLLEAKSQVSHLEKSLEQKDQQVSELHKLLETPPSPIPTSSVTFSNSQSLSVEKQSQQLMENLYTSEERICTAASLIQKYKERCGNLQSTLAAYQAKLETLRASDSAVIEQLQVEISNLSTTLAREQATQQEDKKHLLEARKQFEQLFRDYQELLTTLSTSEITRRDESIKRDALIELERRKKQEELDSLTAQLMSLKEEMQDKSEELNRLKSQFAELKREAEEIPILRAQAEVYKEDFTSERRLRQKAEKETVKLKDDLKALLSHNSQLLDELNGYRQSQVAQIQSQVHQRNTTELPETVGNVASPVGWVSSGLSRVVEWTSGNKQPKRQEDNYWEGSLGNKATPTNSGRDRSWGRREESKSQPATHEENLLHCPKCHLAFKDFQPLQNHVEQCLENDDPFL